MLGYLKHNYLEKLIRTGQVRIDGSRVKSSYRLKTGEKITINSDYVKNNLGELVKDTDLSKFIL